MLNGYFSHAIAPQGCNLLTSKCHPHQKEYFKNNPVAQRYKFFPLKDYGFGAKIACHCSLSIL